MRVACYCRQQLNKRFLLLVSQITVFLQSTAKSNGISGKKYLALKPNAIPEGEVALGQMPTLKYVDPINIIIHGPLTILTALQFLSPVSLYLSQTIRATAVGLILGCIQDFLTARHRHLASTQSLLGLRAKLRFV